MSDNTTHHFSLHIEGSAVQNHAVSASILVQVLENAQRAFELIGLHVEGRSFNERARIRPSTSKKFQLVCEIPVVGCYALPISFGDYSVDLLAQQQIDEAWDKFKEIMSGVFKREPALVNKALPDTALRKKVLDAIKGMTPRAGSNWRLSLVDANSKQIARMTEDTHLYLKDLLTSSEQREASQTVTGQLKSIDFGARKLTMIYPGNNKFLDCFYDESIENLLFENRRQMIQVTGNVILDDDGQPREILEVFDIMDLDMSPFEVDVITHGGLSLQVKERLILEPVLSESKQLICLEDKYLNISVFASTREQLLEELYEQISMLWEEYAQADDSNLTFDAKILKRALTNIFEVIPHAA